MEENILITDLTRMSPGKVCIAGITRELTVIRPEMRYGGIPETYLFNDDKVVIQPRAIIKVNVDKKANPVPPHVEDHLWLEPEAAELIRYLDEIKWKDYLNQTCSLTAESIFGVELYRNKTIEPGTGICSVGTIKPQSIEDFVYKIVNWDGRERRDYRLSFTDEGNNYFDSIKINDLTLQNYVDYLCFQEDLSFEDISEQLLSTFQECELWLRLGLGREWEGRCWLQVNGIYTFPDYLEGKCFADFRL